MLNDDVLIYWTLLYVDRPLTIYQYTYI